MKEKNKVNKSIKNKILAISIFIVFIIIFSVIFALLNINNNNMIIGLKVEGIDISGLSREETKSKLEEIYSKKKEQSIKLKYKDFETEISQTTLETKFDIDKAINESIEFGKKGNIITNNYNILLALLGKKDIKID